MDELGVLLGFYSLDGLVWVWFHVIFLCLLLFTLFDLVMFMFFFPVGLMFMFFDVRVLLFWVCSLILGLMSLLGLFLDLRRTLKNKFLCS